MISPFNKTLLQESFSGTESRLKLGNSNNLYLGGMLLYTWASFEPKPDHLAKHQLTGRNRIKQHERRAVIQSSFLQG